MNLQLGVLAGRSLFTVAGRTYAWEDVLLAAELRGELGELERQASQGLACLRRLEAQPDRQRSETLPAETLRAAATVFRYEHNLLAAEELEAWLDARGLSIADWNGYLRRLVLRERWADELEQIESEFAVGDDEVEAALAGGGGLHGLSPPRGRAAGGGRRARRQRRRRRGRRRPRQR